MPKEALEYPQIAADMIDIWLANPVTKTVLQCFEFKRLDVKDAAGSGELVDSSNADLTHGVIHRALGQQDAFKEAQKPRELLSFYNLILEPKTDE